MFILSAILVLLYFSILFVVKYGFKKYDGKKSLLDCLNAVLSIVALDQLVKYWTVQYVLGEHGGRVELWEGVFRFSYVENRGAAFGMLQNHRWIFIVLTLIFIAFGIFCVVKNKLSHPLTRCAAAMIIAGGIGNIIDRVFLGYVVDTFDFCLINFAVFNTADSFVCVGAILLIIGILLTPDKKKAEINAKNNA